MEAEIYIGQKVAILIDGNNIEKSIHSEANTKSAMLNFDTLVPKLLDNRQLNRLIYFREGKHISTKLAERLHMNYHGSVMPCHKSADIPLSIKATQLANKVDTVIIMSGDSDYVELVRHLRGAGVRVEIAAVESTTAGILVEETDYFHPITEEDWFIHHNSKKTSKKRAPSKKKASKKPQQDATS
ncbi:MAG: NYN domain-containing protein [Bdellovibrionales bacterium]